MTFWVLDADGAPQETDDFLVWSLWMASADRHIRDEHIGRVRVSTVFLGLNQAWRNGPPVLWETLIFGGVFHGYQTRYRSRVDALRGHWEAMILVGLYRHAPRRMRKSVRKSRRGETRPTRGDVNRVVRFLHRHAHLSEVL